MMAAAWLMVSVYKSGFIVDLAFKTGRKMKGLPRL
jgi:hypothetical protein